MQAGYETDWKEMTENQYREIEEGKGNLAIIRQGREHTLIATAMSKGGWLLLHKDPESPIHQCYLQGSITCPSGTGTR